jgi:PAS domain-containing protein
MLRFWLAGAVMPRRPTRTAFQPRRGVNGQSERQGVATPERADRIRSRLRYGVELGSDCFAYSLVLVVDEVHSFVAVGGGVKAALDYAPADLLGRRIEDIAAPDLAAAASSTFDRFLADGRQDGEYRLVARDGREVAMRYQARAHYPIPGFHTSRLWPT